MHAVVIDRLEGQPAALAKTAAAAIGGTAYDVMASMNVAQGGPAVIAVNADPGAAEAVRAALCQAGFHAAVHGVQADLPHVDVRRFELGEHALMVEERGGRSFEIPYGTVDLLIRVTAVTTTSSTTTVRERKFNLARSALSGGLINTKTQKTTKTTRETDSVDLLYVFSREATPLRMADNGLQYQGLGAAIAPSRTMNFAYTVKAIQGHCPQAHFDERLRRRAAQGQMLGRVLSPDEHLGFAIAMIARSVRNRAAAS
ncbi:MAG: hypothetical protein JKY37_30105 [Nannocystaceae bacterium]|nr:hypothetical protein [Nannocystaceae bacterium]